MDKFCAPLLGSVYKITKDTLESDEFVDSQVDPTLGETIRAHDEELGGITNRPIQSDTAPGD